MIALRAVTMAPLPVVILMANIHGWWIPPFVYSTVKLKRVKWVVILRWVKRLILVTGTH